ncbi:hypothetical protein Tco_0687808, partial [Tanacetum coccineum]
YLLVVIVPAGSVIVPAGSVITTGSVIVLAGSVIPVGSVIVLAGSVITTGSVIVPAGSVITTGSVIVPAGVTRRSLYGNDRLSKLYHISKPKIRFSISASLGHNDPGTLYTASGFIALA